MKRVFISRDLDSKSIFAKMLGKTDVEIHDLSLIEFERLPFKKTPPTVWTFFYSKQGIRYFFETINSNAYLTGTRMRMPRKITIPKYAVFGKASAKFLKDTQGIEADFVGTGDPETTAKAFLKKAKGRKTLFIRGQQSRRSVQELLDGAIESDELVVYNNQARKKFKIPACDYLVFTSPLNVETYYKRYKPKKKQTVIAIGATTAEALLKAGINKMIIASQPSEQKLAEIVLLGND